MMKPSNGTVQSFVHALAEHGSRTAVLQMRQSSAEPWSYSELLRCSTALASGLCARGLDPGAHVILLAPNSVEWLVACLALLEAGLVPVPVDSQVGPDDLRHIVEDSASKCAFTTEAGAERLNRCGASRELSLVLLDRAGDEGSHWRELLDGQPREHATAEPGDTAVLFYTSGTSGRPKGVPLSHANIVSNVTALLDEELVRPDDRLLLPLPLHHVYPFVVGLLTPLRVGMCVILPRSLVGAQFLRAMQHGDVTVLIGVPRLYAALLDAIEQRLGGKARMLRSVFRAALRLSIGAGRVLGVDIGRWLFAAVRRRVAPRLRLLVSGGAQLELGLAQKLQGLGWLVVTGYGLTETSPILALNRPGSRPSASAGKPLSGVELRSMPVPDLRHGEVQAKGPNVFSHYHNLPDKTREAFTDDGWFKTGDLGYFDESGTLYLVGRASSMIVLPGGENIVPENLEEILERSASIAEIGVLERGGRLVGVVVPERDVSAALEARVVEARIREDIATQSRDLPSYQRLGDLAIDDQPLPRTRLGKIRRPMLAKRYEELERGARRSHREGEPERAPAAPELTTEDHALIEDPVAGEVWAWIGERFADQSVTPETSLRMDLGVDSLEWLNLTLEIRHRVGVDLSDEAVARIETVRDLLQECTTADDAERPEGDAVELLRDPDSLLDAQARAWLETRAPRSRWLDALAVGSARLLTKTLFSLRVDGAEGLPAAGPYVLAPNHLSALDPIVIAAALGTHRLHNTYWGGWVSILFRGRLTSALSRAMRVLPVEPRSGPLANLALAAAALVRGCNLVWFPEGERSPTGDLQRFRPGIGLLLRAHSVAVVPAWIEGSRRALPPGTLRPRRARISLRFGEPVVAAELEAEGSGETAEERIASGLRERVRALGAAEQPRPYAKSTNSCR